MADRTKLLARVDAQIDAIEREMRRLGYWSEDSPNLMAEVEAGRITTYLDAPSFELWLQCLFIPNARDAVRSDSLPAESDVGVMAMRQWDYQSIVPEAQNLMGLLQEFDRLVKKAARSR
jgi:uncharacterized protein YqcC (DUF446 family)